MKRDVRVAVKACRVVLSAQKNKITAGGATGHGYLVALRGTLPLRRVETYPCNNVIVEPIDFHHGRTSPPPCYSLTEDSGHLLHCREIRTPNHTTVNTAPVEAYLGMESFRGVLFFA